MHKKGGLRIIRGTIRDTWELNFLAVSYVNAYNINNHKCSGAHVHTHEPQLPLSFSTFLTGGQWSHVHVGPCDSGVGFSAHERLIGFCILLNQ